MLLLLFNYYLTKRRREREEVEKLVRELVEGDKGKQMKSKAMTWKRLAEDAPSAPNGSSTKLKTWMI